MDADGDQFLSEEELLTEFDVVKVEEGLADPSNMLAHAGGGGMDMAEFIHWRQEDMFTVSCLSCCTSFRTLVSLTYFLLFHCTCGRLA
jgi:hypothetical protein